MVSRGVEIDVGRQRNGLTFQLSPHAKEILRGKVPEPVLNTSVFVSYDTKSDFEFFHGPVWEHVALLLTRLSPDQLAQLGGFVFVDRSRDDEILFSQPSSFPGLSEEQGHAPAVRHRKALRRQVRPACGHERVFLARLERRDPGGGRRRRHLRRSAYKRRLDPVQVKTATARQHGGALEGQFSVAKRQIAIPRTPELHFVFCFRLPSGDWRFALAKQQQLDESLDSGKTRQRDQEGRIGLPLVVARREGLDRRNGSHDGGCDRCSPSRGSSGRTFVRLTLR